MRTALLLCAISVEWKAILAALDHNHVERFDSGRLYEVGQMTTDSNTWKIVVGEVGVGNVQSALETDAAVRLFNPDVALFVGVAGGIKDVALGDVVIATKMHLYESGKDDAHGLRVRPGGSSLSDEIIQVGRSIARNGNGMAPFRVFTGPIAAGEKVVSSSRSATAELIRAHYGDALAVEMEGGGFVAAMQRHAQVKHGVIRGVSDLLDSKGESDGHGWQPRAASNAVATVRKCLARLPEFLGESIPLPTLIPPQAAPDDAKLDSMLRGGIPSPNATQSYILIAPKGSEISVALAASELPFNAVLDLDPESDRTGVMSECKEYLSAHRLVHLVSPEDTTAFTLSSVAWIAVRGIAGRQGDVAQSLSAWIRRGRRAVSKLVDDLARQIGGRHVTVVIATDGAEEDEWVRALAEDALSIFGSRCGLVAIGARTNRSISALVEQQLSMSAGQLREALHIWLGSQGNGPAEYDLPHATGQVSVSAKDVAWLAEDLEPLWLHNSSCATADSEGLEFLRGGQIGWRALAENYDVPRALQTPLAAGVRQALETRRTVRFNLFHEPGAGGTTLARRVAFDCHRLFPTLEVRAAKPVETARRIDWIARLTEHPVLVLIDSAELSDRFVGELIGELRATSVPAVLLHVSRRYSEASADSTSLYLKSHLSDAEATEFCNRYSAARPRNAGQLREVLQAADLRCNPFFFALTAFEDDFVGLDTYINHRLEDLSESQQDVAISCALAHYYGQQGLPEYRLAEALGLPSARAGSLQTILNPGLRSLLLRSTNGRWRTVHNLVAEQMLEFIGGGTGWRRHLSDWGRNFANLCRGDESVPSEELLETARSVFIYRGSDELLGNATSGRDSFSHLIEDVPSADGAAGLLAHVAEKFPNEAHFAAHVARFYAFRLRSYERASEFADRASRTNPESSVLRHVLGMVYRAHVYDSIGTRKDIGEFIETAKKASVAFQQARALSGGAGGANEYAYISDAQMKIRVVDYAVRTVGSIAAYLRGNPHSYVVSCIADAEELLSEVRGARESRAPSQYEVRSTADLTKLYGDYAQALQMFDSLLSRADADSVSVRRQIVWTHLARAGREWRELPQKSVKRIVELLEENLTEAQFFSSDIRQWFRAIRYLEHGPSQDRVFELLAYWREGSLNLDALYYSYVAYATDVLDGIATSLPSMQRYLEDCSNRARGQPRRTWSFEWVGHGSAIQQLVHQSELGSWDPESDFWTQTAPLRRLSGRVSEIKGPHAGEVTLNGMQAFFVPRRAGLERGRDENALVSGYLGFSQDGLRFWSVEREA